MREKQVSLLVVILFVSVLGANIIGEALRSVVHFIAGGGSSVERARLDYVTYPIGPHSLNLIILSLSFELS